MSGRDYQRSRVYKWEAEHIGPHDKGGKLGIDQARLIAQAIWMGEGLLYPPTIELLPPQTTRFAGKANRTTVQLMDQVPRWVIIHELAHAMTGEVDGNIDLHGPDFVGVYMKLVEKYLRIPLPLLMFTASKEGVEFNLSAKPYFLEDRK